MNVYDAKNLGKEAESLEKNMQASIETQMVKADLVQRRGDGCEFGEFKWAARLLTQSALVFDHTKKQWHVNPTKVGVQLFRPTGPQRTTNEDTPFETSAQRGEGRTVTIRLVPQKRYGMGDPDDDRIGDTVYANTTNLVEVRQEPFVSSRTMEDCSHSPLGMFVEFTPWVAGVMVEGCFAPSEKPVVVSNWALPTVGERVLV